MPHRGHRPCPLPWADPRALRPVNPTRWKVLTYSDVHGPAFLLCHGAHFCHGVSQVGGEGPVDVRLQLNKTRHGSRTREERTNVGMCTASCSEAAWLPSPRPYREPRGPTTVLRFQNSSQETPKQWALSRHSSWDAASPARL